jgi:hypothetical protein
MINKQVKKLLIKNKYNRNILIHPMKIQIIINNMNIVKRKFNKKGKNKFSNNLKIKMVKISKRLIKLNKKKEKIQKMIIITLISKIRYIHKLMIRKIIF